MNLLQLVGQACMETGLTAPNAVVTSANKQNQQFLGIANMLGQQLVSDFEWNKIDKTNEFQIQSETQTGTTTLNSAVITGLSDTSSFNTSWMVTGSNIFTPSTIVSVDSSAQVTINYPATGTGSGDLTFTQTMYDLPLDWDRQINRTHWDRTNHWEMVGPKSAQEWQWLMGGIVATGPRVRYRILGGKFQIWPVEVSTSQIAYEYVSNNWIYATGQTATSKSSFSADTDTCIFRDRLMIAGMKLKFWQSKGLDTTSFQRDFDNEYGKAMAQDHGAPTLSLAPMMDTVLISPLNIPDGNVYGQ